MRSAGNSFTARRRTKRARWQGAIPAQLTLRNGQLVAHDGAAEHLEEAFRRLGTSVIEEYAEFIPHGAPPDAVKKLYAGKVTFVGGPEGEKMMYAMGAEFVEVGSTH